MAQGGLWHKMEKDLVDIQNGAPDLLDEMSDSKMLYNENKRAFALREHEFGGHGNVRARSVFSKSGKVAGIARMFKWRSGSKVVSVLMGWSD